MDEHPVDYFTDGSKNVNGTKVAFVVIKGNREKIMVKRFKLNLLCNVYQAELLALDKAMEDALKHKRTKIALSTDSISLILSITS